MRLDQFKVGDKVQCPRGRGPSDEYSIVRYVAPTFVVLAPSCILFNELVVQQTDSWYGYYEKYESVEDLRQQVQELRVAGFNLYTGIRDAAWTNQGKPALHGPTPHMRDASNAWTAVTGDK